MFGKKKYIKNILFLLIFATIFVFINSCNKDFDKITVSKWNPDLASPFVKTKLTLHDLIGEDSTFDYGDDSLLIYYYQTDSLIYINADTVVNFKDTSTVSNFSLQDVVIEDFNLEAYSSLSDVLPYLDPDIADTLQEYDGEEVIVPPFNLQSSYSITLPPVPYYETVKFSDGFIIVKLENELPIKLDNVNYEVWDEGNNSMLIQFDIENLESGDTYYDTLWLAGKTVSNSFSFKINYFSTSGSYPDLVLLDLSKGLRFSLDAGDLKVVSGTAIIDEQLNYYDDTYVEMGFDEAKIKKVKFASGILEFTFDNEFDLSVDIILQLTSANVNGEVPTQQFNLPANGEYSGSWDLADMEVDLSTDSAQPYNSFPVSLKVVLEQTNELVTFDTSQKVHIDFGTRNVVMGYAEGNIGQQINDIDEDTVDIDLSFFNAIAGDLYFDDAQLSLSYTNSFGIPVLINTDFIGYKNSTGDEMKLDIDSIILDYPQTPYETVEGEIVFNHDNSNIVEFLNFRPDKFIYSGTVVTDWNNDTSNFLTKDSYLLGSSELKIPMVFRTSSLVFNDTADIDIGDIGITIGKGRFYLDVTNGFPFNIELNLKIPDSITGIVLDSLVIGVIPSAQVDADGKVIAPVQKLVTADFDEDFVTNLEKANKLLIWARTVTADGGTIPVGLYSDYEMDVIISFQMQIAP